MRAHLPSRGHFLLSAAAVCLVFSRPLPGVAQAQPVVLDRVVAVVNNQTILASDVDDEVRLAVLEPGRPGLGALTPTGILDQLISRVLIQQQIREQDAQAALPTDAEVDARIGEIRNQLPACVRERCVSDAEWSAFLASRQLTPKRVRIYMRTRLEILKFIEQRFREGIRISPQEVETYYKQTLLPLYGQDETAPTLEKVSTRIQEILLQQEVNALFEDWLKNLRSQGNIEVLDPALESPDSKSGGEGAGQ